MRESRREALCSASSLPSRHYDGDRGGYGYVRHHGGRATFGLVLVFSWIVVFGLTALQDRIPFYQSLRLREVLSGMVLFGFVVSKHHRSDARLWFPYGLFSLYIFLTVGRSTSYAISEMVHVYLRVVQYTLLLLVVPAFVGHWRQARLILWFVVVFCVLGGLAGPLQEVTGSLPWSDLDWAWEHGRAGFARYRSIFGDPNIAAMIGGVFPLMLFDLKASGRRSRAKSLLLELGIWCVSIVLVAYSLSFTGVLLLASSLLIRLFVERRNPASILRLGTAVGLIAIVLPGKVTGRIIGTIQRFLRPASYSYFSSGTHLRSDVLWRLLAHWDLNDTIVEVLFGSTYDLVTPATYINPSGILAHNGYKEMYLAGGLLGLGIFLVLLLLTAWKAWRLILRGRQLPRPLRGTALSAAWIYLLLLVVMFGFPVYHYNGIGILFWCAAGLIHLLYNRPEWFARLSKTAEGRGI